MTNEPTNETSPVPAIIAHNPVASEIYWQVMHSMQEAEEAGGPEGYDYVDLMDAITNEARNRAAFARLILTKAEKAQNQSAQP